MHRSRGGCQNCKKRKRRCDESRPACQACQKRGLECRGYDVVLRWTNGIASRGRLAGATTFATAAESSSAASARSDSAAPQQHQDGAAVATAPVALSPHEARLSDAPATAPHEDGSSFDGNWASPAITATSYEGAPGPGSSNRDDCSPYAQSTPISGPDNTKQELFDRFELELVEANTSGGPRASLLHPVISSGFQRLYATRTGSWLEPYMAAMAQESDALFHVLVAIQAFLEDGLTVSSMDFIDQALQKFRLELAQPRNARTRATMTAGLLVCTIQLLQARPWTSYLQLIAGLYRLGGDMDQLPSDLDLRDAHALHTVEVLAVMDMPVFVVGRTSPSIGVWQRLRAVQNRQRHGGQQHGGEGEGAPGGVEQISGVPRSLLDVFARIPEGPSGEVERDLWYWEGEIGEIPQSHLWDAWRYSGMLSIRHQRRLRAKAGEREALREGGRGGAGGKAPLPADGVLLCRLISSMDSLLQSLDRPEYGHLLVFNSMRYPLVAASLQVTLLEAYPDWKMLLKRVRSRFAEMDSTGVGVMDVLSELLDEVWKSGVDDFDIDKAAMSRGVEIALF